MSRHSPRGFTLLESMVALAVLAISLVAIFNLNSGALRSHAYVKRLTVATLLARSKMTDLEQKLYDDGLPSDDDEESGDFSDEGFEAFKWRAKIIAPKTDGVSPEQIVGALFNLPMGGGDAAGMSSLFSGGGAAAGAAGGAGAAAGLGGMGMAGGLISTQFQQMVQSITQTVREVHLTVSWKDGDEVETINLVTHIVSLGQGSDRNGGGPQQQAADANAAAAAAAAAGAGAGGGAGGGPLGGKGAGSKGPFGSGAGGGGGGPFKGKGD